MRPLYDTVPHCEREADASRLTHILSESLIDVQR